MSIPRSKSCLMLFGILAAGLSGAGDLWAADTDTELLEKSILTKAKIGLLCRDKAPDQFSETELIVSPEEIASRLFERAGINIFDPNNQEKADLETLGYDFSEPRKSALEILRKLAVDELKKKDVENEPNKDRLIDLMNRLRIQISRLGEFLHKGHKKTPYYTVIEDPLGNEFDLRKKYLQATTHIRCVAILEAEKEAVKTFRWAIRDKPEDLVIARDSTKFKKLSHAGINIEENKGANKSSISANVTLGVTLGKKKNAPIAFAQFNSSKSKELVETVPEGGGDPVQELKIKQSEVFSPGILWAGSIPKSRKRLFSGGKWGGLIKASFDIEHDAETLLGRIWMDPEIGKDNMCSEEDDFFIHSFWYQCRVELFVELAHILDAGSHPTLLSVDKSEYLGLGGELTFLLSPKKGKSLPDKFFIRGRVRYLGVVHGKLSDQKRYEATIGFALNKKKNLVLELSYINGESITTYLKEDKVTFQLGAKY